MVRLNLLRRPIFSRAKLLQPLENGVQKKQNRRLVLDGQA